MEKPVTDTPLGVFDMVMSLYENETTIRSDNKRGTVIVSGVEILSEEVSYWLILKYSDDERLHDAIFFAEQQARLSQYRLAEKGNQDQREIEDFNSNKENLISLDMEYLAIRLLSRFWVHRDAFREAFDSYWQKEGADREQAQRDLLEAHLI